MNFSKHAHVQRSSLTPPSHLHQKERVTSIHHESVIASMSTEPAEKRSRTPITIGYWKIRGLAQPIRLLLAYTRTEFEDVRYDVGDAPEYSKESWLSVKFTLGLDFPNLPYLVDGNVKITQSNAILRYVARKNNMCGGTDEEKAIVDMMECEAMDLRNGFVRICYNKQMESMKENYLKTVKEKLTKLSKFLGTKKWFAGEEITYPDFHLYEMFDQHKMFEPTLLDGLDNLKAFVERFEALPAIQEYMKSDRFIRNAVNNPYATWSGP